MKHNSELENRPLTYKEAGIDYNIIDPLKKLAQKAARKTADNLLSGGFKEVAASRGESAYVVDMGDFYIASITECLGTKSLIADRVEQLTGKTYYDNIAQDTIACAVNDVITVGAKPLTVHAYWAIGGMDWFKKESRAKALVTGWQRTCNKIGVAWGGGETPSLTGIIEKGAIDLAASCVGIIQPKQRLSIGQNLQPGDAIILLESNGIHANGLTLAGKLAEQLKLGFKSKIPGGRLYGPALLDPTIIYFPLTEALYAAGIEIHYMSNITGHGWRKIMRHPASLVYRINLLPPVPPILEFIVQSSNLSPYESYATFNMGAGYAIFMANQDAEKTVDICKSFGIKAYKAGVVEQGRKQVIIEPLNIVYQGRSLDLRA